MAPKAKPKAKAKAGKAGQGGDEPTLPVPAPPPEPLCIPFPESMIDRYAMERCLLLTWSDPKNEYKLQTRAYVPGEAKDKPGSEVAWVDALDKERVYLPVRSIFQDVTESTVMSDNDASREAVWLVKCEHVRLQYRLVTEKGPSPFDGMYVANWSSHPSVPVASFIDQPVELSGAICFESDVLPPSVALCWTSSNMELLRKAMGEGTTNEIAYAGMMPMKVQVRWRVVSTIGSMDALPPGLTQGKYFTSSAIDNIMRGGAQFDSRNQAWRMYYKEIVLGVVARFSVRVGTAYRWSPWSEESDDVDVEVPEPTPVGAPTLENDRHEQNILCVELENLLDCEVVLSWSAFVTPGTVSSVEYRVTLCALDDQEEIPQFDACGMVLTTFVAKDLDVISYKVRRLCPNTCYAVRVDARYPYVGKRAFSNSKGVSPCFKTPFPPRPPLQPLPVLADLMEDCAGSPQAVDGEGVEEDAFDWTSTSWVALRVEHGYLSEYDVEFKSAVEAGDDETQDYFRDWQAPLRIEVIEKNVAPDRNTIAFKQGESETSEPNHWTIIRVALGTTVPEVVICRLVHKRALESISPLQWSVVTAPLVPFMAPVSFAGRVAWASVSDEAANLRVRFFLHPGPTSLEEHLAHLANSATERPKFERKLGHRFANQYQLRFRSTSASFQEKDWVTLEKAVLPPACPTHATIGSRSSDAVTSSVAQELGACLGWYGSRYEVSVDPGAPGLPAILASRAAFELQVRVGNDHRWCEWCSPLASAEVKLPLQLIAPTPLPISQTVLDCNFLSPTRLRLSWVPFDRAPGIVRVEYVVRAVPIFGEDDAEAGPEGAEAIERSFAITHAKRSTDDDLLLCRDARRLLDEAKEVPLKKLMSILEAERKREREEDAKQAKRVEVELGGLLPCTRYDISVSARYPTACNIHTADEKVAELPELTSSENVPSNSTPRELIASIESPGGESAPSAPRAGTASEATQVAPAARSVLLNIERREGYILEYRAAGPTSAHFDARNALPGLVGPEFGGSWQDSGSPWRRVPCTSSAALDQKQILADGSPLVWAELPGFDAEDTFLPDVVEFRLCTAARSAAHPCRWAGGISPPMSVCFAPPRRAPKVRRVLSDERWCLSLTIELFKATSPSVPQRLIGSADDDDDDDAEHEEDDDREFVELRRTHVVPMPPKESWSDSDVRRIPVGYGHRMVTIVEFQYSLQSAMTPLLRKQLEERTLSKKMQQAPSVAITQENLNGNRCTLEVSSDAGLLDGGIYVFQVRVGDGCRWSAWSPLSNAFVYRVPPPMPPSAAAIGTQQPVTVEVVSSTVARVRWCDFRPAPGLTLLEYEVRATPQLVSQNWHGCAAVTTVFEHKYRGGWIEREVANLLPFTPYVFSVQARYPKVGGLTWTGMQSSEPVTLEHPMAAQDPPTPFAVADVQERESEEEWQAAEPESQQVAQGSASVLDVGQRCVALSFPDEEDGAHYYLEYAHVLDEEDTSELRANQSMWHLPSGIEMIEPSNNSDEMPRWRIRLPDLRSFRSEPLKLALLQRVRFRLRAKFTSEAPTTRWWSSLSSPVVTGFAGPEGVAAALVAASDRLAVEVQFSLDRRLADALAAAGSQPMRAQRAELDKYLQEDKATTVETIGIQNSNNTGQPTWPRGFGHPFATRYQLRIRYFKAKGNDSLATTDAFGASNAELNWGPWDVHPDSALPKETDRGGLGGWFAGSAGNMRGTNPQARGYTVEMPQVRGKVLMPGDVVQIAVRIGDGTKWSAWRTTKDVNVVVPPPRPAREGDTARAEWIGGLCTVSWPAALGPLGLETIEYQLMVEPDSAHIPPRIGAILVTTTATSRKEEVLDHTSGGTSGSTSGNDKRGYKVNKRGTQLTGSTPQHANQSVMPMIGEGTSDSGPQPSPTGQRRGRNRGSILNLSADSEEKRNEQVVSAELRDLCTDLRYGFTIWARYPTVGPRTFTKIYEIAKVSWRSNSLEIAAGDMQIGNEPPVPEQVTAPKDGRLRRWMERRFVLLTFPSLELSDDGKSILQQRFELQSCKAPEDRSPRNDIGGKCDKDDLSWLPCSNVTALRLDGVPCLAVLDLPFLVGQFRLFDPGLQRAGLASKFMVSFYEAIVPAPAAELQALGKTAPRTLAVQLKIYLTAPGGTQQRASVQQVRFRPLGLATESAWEELDPARLDAQCGKEVAILVREEDGLELGPVYEFAVRVGDAHRLGGWSEPSKPLKFAVSPPVAPKAGGLRVVVGAEQAEIFWPSFQPDATLALRMPGFANLPIEYTLGVYVGTSDGPVATFVTRDTQIIARGLSPGSAYSAVLSARWTRFGAMGPSGIATSLDDDKKTSLMAAFVTAHSPKKIVAEVSLRMPHEKVGSPTTAILAMDGSGPSAVTVDLDPYYGSIQPPNLQQAFVRKPTVPMMPVSSHPQSATTTSEFARAQGDDINAFGDDEEPPLKGRPNLPALVPMPPPKFTTRDPLSFAPLIEISRTTNSRYATTPRRHHSAR